MATIGGWQQAPTCSRRHSLTTPWRLRFSINSSEALRSSLQGRYEKRRNRIRRRLNATARHVKDTDYVGQASRRYRRMRCRRSQPYGSDQFKTIFPDCPPRISAKASSYSV
jgi:hypothetical protein